MTPTELSRIVEGDGPLRHATRLRSHKNARVLATGGALILGNLSRTGLGLVFWFVAAHFFLPSDIGLAAAAVSAMLLCIQLALLGTDSAAIYFFPVHRSYPEPLLRKSFKLVAVSALCTGTVFLVIAGQTLDELNIVATSPAFAITFLVACWLGSLLVLADGFSIAMWRPDQIIARALVFGTLTLCALGSLIVVFNNRSAQALFSCWLIGSSGAAALGTVYLRRTFSPREGAERRTQIAPKHLVTTGLPNYALTLAQAAPGLVMSIVVTETLSPETNAYWYTVWIGAMSVYLIPIAAADTLFAEVSDPNAAADRATRRSLGVALGLGIVVAAVLEALAPQVLTLLGDRYADAAATPLRILVAGVVPMAFFLAYVGLSRATRRFHEAVPAALLGGLMAVAGGAVLGSRHGLVGIAWAWLAAQFAMGIWGGWRVWRITRVNLRKASAVGDGPSTALGWKRQ